MSEDFFDDSCVCDHCGNYYDLRDGQDPTKYCDECAHKLLADAERKLRDYESGFASRQSAAFGERIIQLESAERKLAEIVRLCEESDRHVEGNPVGRILAIVRGEK